MSSDDDDGWEEATGIFKAVMSSEAQNVGGSQAGSLLVGRTRIPESDSAAADNTTFPFKKHDNFTGFPLVISPYPSFILVHTILFTFDLYLSFLSHSSVCLTFSAL